MSFQESQKQKQYPTGKFVEEVYFPQSLLGIAICSGIPYEKVAS